MRPGILIQHSRQPATDADLVRGDVLAVLGMVLRRDWPDGSVQGDFVDLALTSWREWRESEWVGKVDAASVAAVRAFFANGGEQCHLFAVCVESPEALFGAMDLGGCLGPAVAYLRGEENIGLLAMPVLAYLPFEVPRAGRAIVPADAVVLQLLAHCQEMNHRFLIVDPPRNLHGTALLAWVARLRERAGDTGSYGAVYYPWLNHRDQMLPPSGSVAGVFARVENERAPVGVRWPPANEVVQGVTHPSVEIRGKEQDLLVDAHINPVVTHPGRGIVVWGARTLSTDPQYTFINVRRITSAIAEQLRRDSEWVVFEDQRPELWETLTRRVQARLDLFWSAGALTGEQAGEEYLVRCDEELNPPAIRDAGQVHIQVAIRPVSTTEQIVIDLRLGE